MSNMKKIVEDQLGGEVAQLLYDNDVANETAANNAVTSANDAISESSSLKLKLYGGSGGSLMDFTAADFTDNNVRNSGGNVAQFEAWASTPPINIRGVSKIIFETITVNAQVLLLSYLDASGVFISGVRKGGGSDSAFSGEISDFPTNAATFQIAGQTRKPIKGRIEKNTHTEDGDIPNILSRLESLEDGNGNGGHEKIERLTAVDFTDPSIRLASGAVSSEFAPAWMGKRFNGVPIKISFKNTVLHPKVMSVSFLDAQGAYISGAGLKGSGAGDEAFTGDFTNIPSNASSVWLSAQVQKNVDITVEFSEGSTPQPPQKNNELEGADPADRDIFFAMKPNISWCAIGDSITYLNDHANETGNRVKKGYLTRTVEKLKGLTYNNIGINGSTSQDWVSRGLPFADLYTVLIGTNDWYNGVSVGSTDDYINARTGSILGNIGKIKKNILAANSKAIFIIMTCVERSDFVYIANKGNNKHGSYKPNSKGIYLRDVALALKNACESAGDVVLDLNTLTKIRPSNCVRYKRLLVNGTYQNVPFPEYTDIQFNTAWDYPYPEDAISTTYDGLHLSDTGCEIVARLLAAKILDSLNL